MISSQALYALAELNLDKQATIAAAKAKMGPGLQAWVEDNQGRILDDLNNDMKKEPPAPPPAPPAEEYAEQADVPNTPAPAPPVAAVPPRRGPRIQYSLLRSSPVPVCHRAGGRPRLR